MNESSPSYDSGKPESRKAEEKYKEHRVPIADSASKVDKNILDNELLKSTATEVSKL